jgi:hypothetical protein
LEEARFFRHRFSWSVAFAGAAIATATILFLLSLGSGVGLTLVRAQQTMEPAFLTLGAIYFLAAQAFGFAVGGHVAGRLIGPAPESAREEDFRAAAHGLVVWAIGVIATAAIILMSGWIAAGAAATDGTLASTTANGSSSMSITPAVANYWTDMVFRPSVNQQHASLAGLRFAQADTGVRNDASPETQPQPMQPQPAPETGNAQPENTNPAPAETPTETAPTPAPNATPTPPSNTRPSPLTIITSHSNPENTAPPAMEPRNLPADKAEVARILETGMANGGRLSAYDKQRVADLISADAGLGPDEAMRRVNDADSRIHDSTLKTADTARRIARNASLWTALSLLFGAIVSAMAAVSARWADDRITFGPRRRREPG